MKIIEVKGIKKYFGEIKAVNDISFDVHEGELFSLLGPNGAGKSTLINILTTLRRQTDGEARVLGFSTMEDAKEIRKSIGIVFQNSVLDEALTAKENLTLRAKLYEKKKATVQMAVQRAVEAVAAQEFLNQPYGTLSGGQRRRVDIARALIHQPRLLILDEPTTGLDPRARYDLWEMIHRIRKEHKVTILLTTHYMEEASLSDRLIMMNHGVILEEGTPSSLKEAYQCATLDEVFLKIHKEEFHYECID